MATRRSIVTGGLAAAVLAAFGMGATAMAITNPNLGLQPGDVTRLRNAVTILTQVATVWNADPRYAGQVEAIAETATTLGQLATDIENYLAVQGT